MTGLAQPRHRRAATAARTPDRANARCVGAAIRAISAERACSRSDIIRRFSRSAGDPGRAPPRTSRPECPTPTASALPDLSTLAPPPSTSGRCASSRRPARPTRSARTSRCRSALRSTAARWRPSTRTAATATPRPATPRPPDLRAALERAAAWARATAKLRAGRLAHAAAARGPRRLRVAVARRAASRSRREWFDLLMARIARRPAIDPRIVDWEAYIEVRTATHRLVTSAGGDVIQRYRFLFPGMSVTAHADGDTQTRTLNGYRGICQQGGDEILARFGFDGARAPDRRGGARAARGAELPERDDGRAAHARPDDPADPRVDRPSAGARPHPRRRAQFRRHELRHAGHVRHVSLRVRSSQRRRSIRRATRSSRATAGTTRARRPRRCT